MAVIQKGGSGRPLGSLMLASGQGGPKQQSDSQQQNLKITI